MLSFPKGPLTKEQQEQIEAIYIASPMYKMNKIDADFASILSGLAVIFVVLMALIVGLAMMNNQ